LSDTTFSPGGRRPAQFYIDGANPGAKGTTVTIYSYNYNGTFLGSASAGQTGGGTFDLLVTLANAQVPTYAYLTAVVVMPLNGKLFGVTSIQ
jgi:hypothetical protein